MHHPAAIHVDDSLWPLLLLRFEGTPSPQQFEAYLTRMSSYLERRERYVVILDLLQTTIVGLQERCEQQSLWMKRHEAQLREWPLGVVIITDAIALRLLVRVILHRGPSSLSHLMVSRLAEAAIWAAERLRQAGLGAEAHRVREHFGLLPDPGPV
jgi:hypothetical protein